MIDVSVVPVTLHLKNPFHIAHGSSSVRENIFLRVISDGKVAYGEAPVVPYYPATGPQIMEDLLTHIDEEMVEKRLSLEVLDRFSYSMSQSAYSSCILSLMEQDTSRTASELLGCVGGRYRSPSSYTVAYDEDVDRMLAHIAGCGFSTIKLKAGFPDDVDRISRIRDRFPSIRLRLDANQGWSFDEAVRNILALVALDIELIEEPMAGTPEEISELTRLSGVPILLDESIQTIEDIELFRNSASGVVVKLAKSGGPQKAREMIAIAEALGLDVMLSCMIESSLALSYALTLAPLCKWIDLDAPLLVTDDVGSPVLYKDQRPYLSTQSFVPSSFLLDLFG